MKTLGVDNYNFDGSHAVLNKMCWRVGDFLSTDQTSVVVILYCGGVKKGWYQYKEKMKGKPLTTNFSFPTLAFPDRTRGACWGGRAAGEAAGRAFVPNPSLSVTWWKIEWPVMMHQPPV